MENNPLFLEDVVYRPPEESKSVLLEVAMGCSYAKCAFCHYSIERLPVVLLPEEEILTRIALLSKFYGDSERMFLLGGNMLAFKTAFIEHVFSLVRQSMPQITEFCMYGRADDILRKGPAALSQLRRAGLDTVYVGLESGDDDVLKLNNKGVTSAQIFEALGRLREAGIAYGLTSITGLGGKALSQRHALATAELYSKLYPRSIRIFNLIVEDGTKIDELIKSGEFVRCDNIELLKELHLLAQHIELKDECLFIAEHVQKDRRFATLLPAAKDKLVSIISSEIQAMS